MAPRPIKATAMEVDMHIAIARFPAVPAGRDQDFRDWFASSNDQLREMAGLKGRRLLQAADGSYVALMEHESLNSFAATRTATAVSMIHSGLGQILNDRQQAMGYEVVVDFPPGPCCAGGPGNDIHEGAAQTHHSGRCGRDAAGTR